MRQRLVSTFLQPFHPERIPLIFVHGLISTPGMWLNVINDLQADPAPARALPVLDLRFMLLEIPSPYSALETSRATGEGGQSFIRSTVIMSSLVTAWQLLFQMQDDYLDRGRLGKNRGSAGQGNPVDLAYRQPCLSRAYL